MKVILNSIKQKFMQQLKDLLKEKIKNLYNIDIEEISLDVPPKKELWDFAFWPFQLSKELKKSPIQISSELLEVLKDEKLIKEANIAWPYLNLKVSNTIFKDLFFNAINDFSTKSDFWKWKTIYIDYIWTNVWKPLHIGHMCTPNQGQAIYNLYKKLGYNVVWDSHLWDWGIIFWKLIYAYKNWWDENKLKENAVDHLLELYVKVTSEVDNNSSIEELLRQEFKKLSDWDKDSILLWQKFTRYSIDAMQTQLDRLHVRPDFDIWESFYEWIWLPKMWNYPDLKYNMKDIVKELIEKGIATKNEDGSVWVIFPDELKIPSCILQKRDWTHWYLASDLAAVKYRMQNWNPEKIVYFVDVRQQLHLNQVFEISKMAWWLNKIENWELKIENWCKNEYIKETELFHAYNWFISWKEGAFSTRKWNIIKLKDLLDEAQERAKKIILEKRQDFSEVELEKLANIIWIWAIKYWYLSKSRTTDVIFDWDEFMTFEGNSWPYIQYAYVRWFKVLQKYWKDIWKADLNILSLANFETDEENELVKELANYKNILHKTASDYMPHILANYSYSLTKKFNAFYNNVRVLEEKDESRKLLLIYLVKLFLDTLKESFEILGIEMPEEM